jgi:hypothetical protein
MTRGRMVMPAYIAARYTQNPHHKQVIALSFLYKKIAENLAF